MLARIAIGELSGPAFRNHQQDPVEPAVYILQSPGSIGGRCADLQPIAYRKPSMQFFIGTFGLSRVFVRSAAPVPSMRSSVRLFGAEVLFSVPVPTSAGARMPGASRFGELALVA